MRNTRRKGSKSVTKTLSVKLPRQVSERVTRLARERHQTVSALVRDALEQYQNPIRGSFAEVAREYIGVLEGGSGDLATNPAHLETLGE